MHGMFRGFLGALRAVPLLLLLCSGASGLQAQEAPPAAGPPYRVGENVTRPEKLSGVNPVYTEIARKAKVTGVVILEAIIDEQGDVTNVRVLKGLPMGLDQAALEAVRGWKFKPATLEGRPVSVYYTLTVTFQVSEEPPQLARTLHAFLEKNPELAAHLQFQRYEEATALLDRWATEQPIHSGVEVARCLLLLAQGRLEEAWGVARAYRGLERFDLLASVGAMAAYSVAGAPSGERRAEIVELGLQAATEAMAVNPEDPLEAVMTKSLLLREKAKLTLDANERDALDKQATELRILALDLIAKRKAAEASAEPPAPEASPPDIKPPV
jgi:TonB family protein